MTHYLYSTVIKMISIIQYTLLVWFYQIITSVITVINIAHKAIRRFVLKNTSKFMFETIFLPAISQF